MQSLYNCFPYAVKMGNWNNNEQKSWRFIGQKVCLQYVLTGQMKPRHTKWILDLEITFWQMLDLKYSVLNASLLLSSTAPCRFHDVEIMAKVRVKQEILREIMENEWKEPLLMSPHNLLLQITELLYKDARFSNAVPETSGMWLVLFFTPLKLHASLLKIIGCSYSVFIIM